LYPHVDFYSGMIYEALGMPVEMLHVTLAIRRTSSWIAQWLEMVDDPEQKIAATADLHRARRGLDFSARGSPGPLRSPAPQTTPLSVAPAVETRGSGRLVLVVAV
jgi:hypothetical protein